MESAAHFRAEAAKCRALAKHARDPMTAANLIALAEDYEAQVQRLTQSVEPRPSMPMPE